MHSLPGSKHVSVSIIVACRNERAYIHRFLKSLEAQQGVDKSLQVVIADGMSEDGTRDILNAYAATSAVDIRVMDNPRKIAASGLNLALRASTGKIILRMDVHTEYASDYITECLRVLAETGAANVGGAARARGESYWQETIAIAFRSPFFSGGARFHNPNYEGPVDTVPYGCWRRETLESLGSFDESLARNQDDELNFRITQAGGRVWQSPRIRSWYFPRTNLRSLARQYFEYGYWKPAVIAKYGRPAQWRHLAPASALALLIALTVAAPFLALAQLLLLAFVAGYGAVSAFASIASVRFGPMRLIPALPLVFATVHASYAAGFFVGGWKQRHAVPTRPHHQAAAHAEAQTR